LPGPWLIRGQLTVADLAGLLLHRPDHLDREAHHCSDASAVIVCFDRALRPDGRI